MASTIILSDNGASSGSAGLKSTAGNDGVLILQTTTSGGSATSALTIDTSQNVGIGTSPSAWASYKVLQVDNGAIANYSPTQDASYLSNAYYNGTWKYIASAYALRYAQDGATGSHKWFTASSGTAGNEITFTRVMTIDSSGNVGIGTSSTSGYKLAVSDGTTYSVVHAGGGASYYGAITNNPVLFITNNTERARIDTSGNLLVGTTSANANVGVGVKLISTGSVYVVNSNQDGFDYYNTTAGAYRFYVTSTGQIYATSTTISAISDARLKENIRDIDTGLDAVLALKPRRFDWKEGKGQDKKDVAGFIAQEFEEVFPECVGTTKAGEDGIEYKNISHETLIPTMVKAIQEQQALITTLTERITALEAK